MELVEAITDPVSDVVVTVDESAPHEDSLSKALSERGLFVATIYLGAADTDETALRLLGQAFRFPSYYGVNWNAANECLADMSWEKAQGYVCLLLPWIRVGEPPQRLVSEIASTFEYAAREWRSKGRACKLVLYPPLSST